jgi:hypothetical protein
MKERCKLCAHASKCDLCLVQHIGRCGISSDICHGMYTTMRHRQRHLPACVRCALLAATLASSTLLPACNNEEPKIPSQKYSLSVLPRPKPQCDKCDCRPPLSRVPLLATSARRPIPMKCCHRTIQASTIPTRALQIVWAKPQPYAQCPTYHLSRPLVSI